MNAKCTVVLCGLLALGLASGVAQANVISWGGGTGTWNTAANWTGGILPTTGDTAVIGSGRPQVNVTLSPAPDVIRVDSGGTACFTGASITNDFVLNGGKFDMGGDSNPTMSGNVLLTADSTIQNTRGNSNRAFKVNGTISEDASPRKLSLSGYPTTGGALMDSTQIGGTNSYSGGTDVTGASNYLKSLGALGSGPVTVSAGRLCFNVAGDYSHGQVTVTGGTVIVGATGISNEVWGFQGGTLTYDQSPRTLDVTNQVTISNTVEVLAGGGYYNNPLTIATSITGDGKAVLNNTGSPSQSVLQISAAQLWTGGTDVKGIVVILSGGSLPAGTVTVYPVSYSYGTGLLRLSVASALNSATDLVLQYDSINDRYGTIMLGANQVVHSLTLDGAVIPAGFYTQADFPNYLVGSGTYTLRVLSPDTGPNAITDLAGTSPDWFKVNLTWTAPADNIDPAATSYDIRYSTSTIDDTNWDTATQLSGEPTPATPGQPESFQVTGLLGGTTYYFALKSSDSGANWSALSNVAVVTTMATDAVAPGAVSDLAAADVKSNYIRLTWTATGDDGSTGQASSYDLRYSTSAISDDTSFSAATPVTGLSAPKAAGQGETFTVTGLTPSTLYYFAIKVADEVPNWSALSNVVSVSTQEADLLPPLAVTDLRVLGVETRAVVLAWTAPADQGPGACASYDLRYSSSPISDDTAFDAATTVSGLPVPATPGTTEQFTVSGLTPDTTYYFAIKTADTAMPANVSALSNSPSGKTRPPVVPVVVHNPWVVNDRVADTHNLATMGATYVNAYTPDGVVAPASDENKAINIYDNQKRRLYHWADEPPSVGGNDINDPTYNQNVFGWCLCGRHASQARAIAQAAGFTQRLISLPGHWVYELQYGGLWHLFDTMTTMYVYNKASPATVASCDDIQLDTTILANAVADHRACPGFLLCGDTVSWYQDAVNHYSTAGNSVPTTRWTGNMDLRLGESFKRTWESWLNEHPPIGGGGTPPYHHEASRDWKDTVNYSYWEPYALTTAQSTAINISYTPTYRRWANGTDTLAPDFRSAGCQALLDAASHDIATFNDDGLTPDLHTSAVNVTGEAIFKINVPYYITDAAFSGDFVRAGASDVCTVYVSSNGTSWTQVWAAPTGGTTNVTNQSLRTNVFGLWTTWYFKVQIKGAAARNNAGVSNLVITTIFEHNKGAMAYVDKGTNNLTLTFDNPAELLASGNVIHIVYKWKEFDGADWAIDKQFERYATASPTSFSITAGGTKVPRTEYILLEVTPPPSDLIPPAAVTDLAAGPAQASKVPLTWTAVGDDGMTGTATAYELRYSTSAITDDDSFDAATLVPGVPSPQQAGSSESFLVTGLAGSTTYYFALKVHDKGGNASALSNVATATTTPPDTTPPQWVGNLLAMPSASSGGVDLTWTAPADYGVGGAGPYTCTSYQVRYSASPILYNDGGATWSAATAVGSVPAPKAPGQAETLTVTGLTGGATYYFALKAVDDSSNVSEVSNCAPAVASVIGERVLQVGVGGYNGTVDSYIMGNSTNNYFSIERMTVTGYADQGVGNIQRGILKFDLSGLPGGATVASATLSLYSYFPDNTKGSTGYYGVYPLTRDWTDSQVNWNVAKTGVNWTTPGGDFLPTPDATAPKQPPTALVWYNWNVTSRVQSWLNGSSTNYGWIVRCTDENLHNQDYFYQCDTANAVYRPKLVIRDLAAPVAGDINGDGAVDVADLLILAYSFGGVCGQDRIYGPRADLNHDGQVDVSDLLILAMHWPP